MQGWLGVPLQRLLLDCSMLHWLARSACLTAGAHSGLAA